MLGEEKYFMAYNLFDLNIRGKMCRLCPCHFAERLENFPQFSFTPPRRQFPSNGSLCLRSLLADNPFRLMYVKQE